MIVISPVNSLILLLIPLECLKGIGLGRVFRIWVVEKILNAEKDLRDGGLG